MKFKLGILIGALLVLVAGASLVGPVARTILQGEDGVVVDVSPDGQLHTVAKGKMDEDNSSEALLGAGEVFVGTSKETLEYAIITVSVYADQDSAVDGFCLEFSTNNTDWYDAECYDIDAGETKTFSFQPEARYYRTKYVNGATPQGTFRLQATLKKTYIKPSSHRIADAIDSDDDAELMKAVLTGENPGGTFINFSATTGGNFKMSLEELENDVSVNSNSQLRTTSFHSDGTGGQLITGIDYASGKSGIDRATETLQVIEYEHHEIHAGSHFNYCDYSLNEAVSATIEFILATPDTTEWTHFTFEVYSSEGATIEIYAGTSGITGGSSITPRNNDGNSAHTSTITITKDPTTITADGIRAAGFLAGGGRTAGLVGRDKEKILKQNETYVLRITSLANSNDIAWCAEWYEHTNKINEP